jgi:hypothetical protein
MSWCWLRPPSPRTPGWLWRKKSRPAVTGHEGMAHNLGSSVRTDMRFGRILRTVVTALAVLLATATPGSAQTSNGQPSLPAQAIPLVGQILTSPVPPVEPDPADLARRMAVLQHWTLEYAEWKAWDERWQGKLEPGWFGAKERRQKPDPPEWLAEECRTLADVEGTLADACRLLAEWREDYSAAQVRARLLAARNERDEPTTWWRSVHIDALWLTPNMPASYGLVGIHATLKVVGRWQVFVAPGAMLLNVPTPRGTREWVPGTDLGVSYRLMDVTLPGNRQGTLHLNVARAWILGGSATLVNQSVDLAGLSVTFK